MPQFSDDESVAVRLVGSELLIHKGCQFGRSSNGSPVCCSFLSIGKKGQMLPFVEGCVDNSIASLKVE